MRETWHWLTDILSGRSVWFSVGLRHSPLSVRVCVSVLLNVRIWEKEKHGGKEILHEAVQLSCDILLSVPTCVCTCSRKFGCDDLMWSVNPLQQSEPFCCQHSPCCMQRETHRAVTHPHSDSQHIHMRRTNAQGCWFCIQDFLHISGVLPKKFTKHETWRTWDKFVKWDKWEKNK